MKKERSSGILHVSILCFISINILDESETSSTTLDCTMSPEEEIGENLAPNNSHDYIQPFINSLSTPGDEITKSHHLCHLAQSSPALRI